MARIDDIERWPETKAVMKIIENEILGVDYGSCVTLKEKYEQLLILQDFVNAQAALWAEYGCTHCFADPKVVKDIYDKLVAEVDRARGFTIERNDSDG